jgi:hypothetical protein
MTHYMIIPPSSPDELWAVVPTGDRKYEGTHLFETLAEAQEFASKNEERVDALPAPRRSVVWSDYWGEWIVIVDDVGYRYFFDCKAEAQHYLDITEPRDGNAYVWRSMEKWAREHTHNEFCKPQWKRGALHENTN